MSKSDNSTLANAANALAETLNDGIPDDDWLRAGLDCEPISPWAIDRLCQRMAGEHHRSTGSSALADRVGVTRRTVTRWRSGEAPCEGPTARVVRAEAEDILRGADAPGEK